MVGLEGQDGWILFFNGSGLNSYDHLTPYTRTYTHPNKQMQVFNELDNKDEADMLALASFFHTLTSAWRLLTRFLCVLFGYVGAA